MRSVTTAGLHCGIPRSRRRGFHIRGPGAGGAKVHTAARDNASPCPPGARDSATSSRGGLVLAGGLSAVPHSPTGGDIRPDPDRAQGTVGQGPGGARHAIFSAPSCLPATGPKRSIEELAPDSPLPRVPNSFSLHVGSDGHCGGRAKPRTWKRKCGASSSAACIYRTATRLRARNSTASCAGSNTGARAPSARFQPARGARRRLHPDPGGSAPERWLDDALIRPGVRAATRSDHPPAWVALGKPEGPLGEVLGEVDCDRSRQTAGPGGLITSVRFST